VLRAKPESTSLVLLPSQDEAQLIAADELCNRGWWWHKKFRCWFIHAPNSSVTKGPNGRSERGTYMFFDTSIWDVVQVSCGRGQRAGKGTVDDLVWWWVAALIGVTKGSGR
jgi:hypothetical protein